jgi:hypothetical protein
MWLNLLCVCSHWARWYEFLGLLTLADIAVIVMLWSNASDPPADETSKGASRRNTPITLRRRGQSFGDRTIQSTSILDLDETALVVSEEIKVKAGVSFDQYVHSTHKEKEGGEDIDNNDKGEEDEAKKRLRERQTPSARHKWCTIPAHLFEVRKGPNYRRKKTKAPSAPAFYQAIAMDVYLSDKKINHICRQVKMPDIGEVDPDIDIPPMFVVNVQTPDYPTPNPVWGTQVEDGVGYNQVVYFVLTSAARQEAGRDFPFRVQANPYSTQPVSLFNIHYLTAKS